MSSSAARDRFVCVRGRASDPDAAERAGAEAWEAGASGIEERDGGGGIELIVYAPRARAAAIEAALAAVLGRAAVGPATEVADEPWPETWKAGLRPLVISPRLVVRPPFAPHALAPGQREVVIEPRQAFGTGEHATTALALEAVDAALAPAPVPRVLDVGCGSGVLALAALALGAGRAVACDLDPVAAHETRENAGRNDLAGRLVVFTGSLDALAAPAFGLVVANLIRREMLPILGGLVAATDTAGTLVLSGLLAAERDEMAAALERAGAVVREARLREDARGDTWLALTARPRAGAATTR